MRGRRTISLTDCRRKSRWAGVMRVWGATTRAGAGVGRNTRSATWRKMNEERLDQGVPAFPIPQTPGDIGGRSHRPGLFCRMWFAVSASGPNVVSGRLHLSRTGMVKFPVTPFSAPDCSHEAALIAHG